MAGVLIDPDAGPGSYAAVTVRRDFAGADALRLPVCQRLHSQWWAQRSPSAA
jgi:hypothetical protein